QDFETLIPATAHTAERRVRWDALRADVQLSPSIFAVRSGTLTRDPDTLRFDFRLQLFQRQLTDASAFQAHLDTQHADLAAILGRGGSTYPVTGSMDAQLQVAGTRADPVGQGHILLRNGTIYGEPVELFTAALDFRDGKIGLKNIDLKHQESTVSGDASY